MNIQLTSVAQLSPNRCNPMDCSTRSFPVHHQLLEEVAGIHRRTVQKSLNDPDDHNGVVAHLETDILEHEVKWDLGRITMNKVSGGDGIPADLLKILKDAAAKVLHSICQEIW